MSKLFLFLLPVILFSACKSQPAETAETITVETTFIEEPEIEILEPEFNVVSIVILQADLVNTQFETVLRVDNPNQFPLHLSSINFELFGNGTFWASGRGNDILHIPANSSQETEIRFSMNFIDMNRRLLDDIIAMRQVNYRFCGNAQIETELPNISPFIVDFDCVGVSNVRQRARNQN